jgi:Tol biopolymer transport system component
MRLEDNSEDVIGQIVVMKADGTEQTVIELDISVSIGYPPAWSPDGQHFMFVHQEGNSLDLYQVNRDGTNLTKVTDSTAFYSAPAWSHQ